MPEPYDITDIPYFPYVPGLTAWAAVIAFLALAVLLRLWCQREREPRIEIDSFAWALAQLKQLALFKQQGSQVQVSRFVSVVRRLLEAVEGIDVASLSPAEILKLQQQLNSEPARKLLDLVSKWMTAGYAPQIELEPWRVEIDEAVREIEKYQNQHRLGGP